MPRWLASICLAFFLATTPADPPTDPARWIETDPPEPYSGRWSVANRSRREWVVSLREGRPRVDLRGGKVEATPLPFAIEPGRAGEGLAGRRVAIEVVDGWLVGFNAGEFGAGLWWFSADGKRREKVAEAWVVGLVATKAGVLAIEGLAHMSTNRGRILRLDRDRAGRWRAEDLVDLGHAPDTFAALADGSLLVATTGRLLKVDPATRKVEVLVDRAFWGGLYSNSMVVAGDGTIYIGMRHGVARVDPGEPRRVRWLLPDRATVDAKDEGGLK